MSAFSPMSYGRRKTGAVNTALFVKRKRKAISALAEYERADGVLKAAKAALESVSKMKKLSQNDEREPYIYGFATAYVAAGGGRISEETLSLALSSASGGFSSDEIDYLPDMLRIAVAERLCDVLTFSRDAEAEVAELYGSDAKISQIDFSRLFFEFCECSRILSEDETYRLCSDESKREYIKAVKKISDFEGISEGEAARKSIELAAKTGKDLSFVLFGQGKSTAIGYFVSIAAITIALSGIYLYLCGRASAIVLCVFLLAPLRELSKRFAASVYRGRGDARLLSVTSGKELEGAHCIVTVATILYGEKRDCEVFDRLEDFYLRNRSENYIFSVLGDLGEADYPDDDGDEDKIAYARSRISALNEKYGGGFALFVRKRTFVGCQKKYMAWERKRGGIIELCRFIGGDDIKWKYFEGDRGEISKCTHLLTLDRDTELFYGSVKKLLGIMLHPMNKPVFDEKSGRVVSGYGVLQPSVTPSLSSASATFFAELTGGEGGLDVYTGTGKELYQSLIGTGCFCGKGMIDVRTFLLACGDSIADERVLSHDVIEGSLVRCGSASSVVLTDGTPKNALSYYTRLHRWIRGDLQSLPYLRKNICERNGEKLKNPIGKAGKYRIADSAIRHFVPLSAMTAVTLSLLFGAEIVYITAAFAFAYLVYHFAESIFTPVITGGVFRAGSFYGYIKTVLISLARSVFQVMSEVHEAYVFADAAIRTIYRFSVSGEHFLDWKTAADGDAEEADILSHYKRMAFSAIFGLLSVCILPDGIKALGALWALYPATAYFLSLGDTSKKRVPKGIRQKLKKLCAKEWRYFADNVNVKTNWLPPDNYQSSPAERTAMRTSPTNIGMFLVSALAARDFGYINSEKLAEYMKNAADSIDKLLKWRGNLYNWYDIQSLEVIGEPFISSVDSGNFLVCLTAVCEGLKEYASEEPTLLDSVKRFEKAAAETDLSALYDSAGKLFYIGYNAGNAKYSDSRYDVFMSEARLTSYYAVATGQVPPEHYFAPARKSGACGGRRGPLSWSGTAFEYFMPALFLPSEKDSAQRVGLDFAYAMQRSSAVSRFIDGKYFSLWGISESQYFGFDGRMNYQYRAFGTAALSLDPEFEKNDTFSPYSAFLMIRENPSAALGVLGTFDMLGASGKYGFCEAVDFCRNRVGDGFAVIKSYMAHHKGMSLAAAANACFADVFIRRFMRCPRMRAGQILLSEKIPENAPLSKPSRAKKAPVKPSIPDVGTTQGKRVRHNLLYPDVGAVSNGKTRIVASSSGHILLSDGESCISYTDFDRFSLSGGLCVVAEVGGKLLSAVPLGYTDRTLDSKFEFVSEPEKITYLSSHRGMGFQCDFSVTLTVSPEQPEFIISAKVSGVDERSRIMLFFEPVMCGEKAYVAHKCFSGLFLECEYEPEEKSVLIRRRPRGNGESVYLGMTAKASRGFEFDSGDYGLSSGYGEKEIAELIRQPCGRRQGAPVVPVFRMVCPKTSKAEFSIGYSKDKDDLLYFLGKKRGRLTMKNVSTLMRSAAGIGGYAGAMEGYLLRNLCFPQTESHCAGEETLFRQMKTSSLYRFSVSGDQPMIAVRFFRPGGRQSENLKAMIGMFRYACIRGIRFDLIILYRESDEYRQSTLSHIKKLVLDMGCESFWSASGGIYALNTEKLDASEEYAITHMCRAVADTSVPLSVTLFSNKYFTSVPKELEKRLATSPCRDIQPCKPPVISGEIKKTEFGTFYSGGFLCDKKTIKRPFAQIVSTNSLGFVATQNSLGFSFGTNSSQLKLTPHDGRAMTEDIGEKLIMRIFDRREKSFEEFDLCACAAYADYFFGGVRYTGRAGGIGYCVTALIDEKLALKYIDVVLSSKEELRADVIYSLVPCLGAEKGNARIYSFSQDTDGGAVRIRRICGEKMAPKIEIITDSKDNSVFTDSAALKTDGAVFGGMSDCAAVSAHIKTGKRIFCSFALIAYRGERDRKFCEESFISGKRRYACEDIYPTVTVKTDDPAFDLTVNRWFLYQCEVSRITARTGFYQNGGAYGFRDQLQDSLSVGGDTLKRQIIFCSCHQYEEGDVMHWWHNLREEERGHFGIRTRCSDDCAWLLYAAEEYIKRSGDREILDMKLPFVSSPQLDTRELERYEFGRFTEEKYTLYEHLLRAAERLCRRGRHGLSLFGTCDWNDGMNEVGKGGKGESVWLSQFAAARLSAFADICSEYGDDGFAEKFAKTSEELRNAVEADCFEVDRYLRGFFDDGYPLGSEKCDECKIDMLTQVFSVLCGKEEKPSERAVTAMNTAVSKLCDYGNEVVKLLSPPFDKTSRSPGYIMGYPPGIRENGGQYTHAAVWGAIALADIGESELSCRLLKMINPALKSDRSLARYGAEPYVLAGDVGSVGRNAGRGGWSWYTGAAGWYRTAVISYICGYRESGGGFYVSPALSAELKGFSLEFVKGKSRYRVSVSEGKENTVILDGSVISSGEAVCNTVFYPDGNDHDIKITVKQN